MKKKLKKDFNEIKKKLNELSKLIQKEKNTDNLVLFKIISLSYLSISVEPIFRGSLKNIKKDLLEKINETILVFNTLKIFKSFSKKNLNNALFTEKTINHLHKNLWQNIWPHHTYQEYDQLVEYRGKRLDYNKIRKEFQNKEVIDFGCGNGSILTALMKRGAKNCLGLDFGKENIQAAKKFTQKYKFRNKMKFICTDILNYKNKKKYDFIVCSAVLHHLNNKELIKKMITKFSNISKNGSYLYIFVRGFGGIRYEIQDTCVKCFKKVKAELLLKHLIYLGFNREKITHLLDWFKAIYLQTKPEYLEQIFRQNGYKKFTRLRGPHKNDSDINQIKKHENSYIAFGSGELRYLCKYNKS